MSSSSDAEEFYDAEDTLRSSREIVSSFSSAKSEPDLSTLAKQSTEEDQDVFTSSTSGGFTKQKSSSKIVQEANKVEELKDVSERRRFRELRQRMQMDEEEVGGSPSDSQASSVEGVYTSQATKTCHPFRVIEHDALSLHSMTSLGRVGRILSGTFEQVPPASMSDLPRSCNSSTSTLRSLSTQTLREDAATSSSSSPTTNTPVCEEKPPVPVEEPPPTQPTSANTFQEPDVIASTKSSNNNTPIPAPQAMATSNMVPVAPPRRKKKNKAQIPTTLPLATDGSTIASKKKTETNVTYSEQSSLPSPASTIESLTREFEHSLDIQSATKGNSFVKTQEHLPAMSHAGYSPRTSKTESNNKSPSSHKNMSHTLPLHMLTSSVSSMSRNSSTYPLGSVSSTNVAGTRGGLGLRLGLSPRSSRERRRSAGDEQGLPHQLNMFVRTRTDSGKQLTDKEILEQVTVLNLDTGERVPLSIAEDKLPQCINPLSLHIMKLTSKFTSNTSLEKERESDEESIDSKQSIPVQEEDQDIGRVKKRTAQIKHFIGSTMKKTVIKAIKGANIRHKEDIMDIVDEQGGERPPAEQIKLRASSSHKGPYDFETVKHLQELSGEHTGPVWCMKFSTCGRLLATTGQDRILRIWVVRSAYSYFLEMRTKYNAEKVSPTPSQESLVSQQSVEDPMLLLGDSAMNDRSPFMPRPFCVYSGHTSDLLDVSWSKNYFILSSSMDKTVRLWHISRKECLCCFQHIDFVTAICFHPRDDRYFLSGSLDGKLRLWNIPDKKVAVWNEVEGQTKLITAANFCQNGKFAVVGSYDGRCIFYNADQLKYHTQIHVRSTRGKNSTGRKISGIEPMPGEDKILVTSNDSRIRLYDLRDLNLSCKYKGYVNVSSQIKASFSHDGKYIVSGSENQCIYIWKTHHDYSKFTSVRRDRNDFWEGIKAHNAVVTCAIFAPNPEIIIKQLEDTAEDPKPGKVEDPLVAQHTKGCSGYVLVSADFNGCIRVFMNKTKPKHSSLPASALA